MVVANMFYINNVNRPFQSIVEKFFTSASNKIQRTKDLLTKIGDRQLYRQITSYCLPSRTWTRTRLSGHWLAFVLVSSFYFLFLVTCTRLSWPHSTFQSTLNSSIVSHRIVLPASFHCVSLLDKRLVMPCRDDWLPDALMKLYRVFARCVILLKHKLLDEHLSWSQTKQKDLVHVKPENLRWTPFVPSPHVQLTVSHPAAAVAVLILVQKSILVSWFGCLSFILAKQSWFFTFFFRSLIKLQQVEDPLPAVLTAECMTQKVQVHDCSAD